MAERSAEEIARAVTDDADDLAIALLAALKAATSHASTSPFIQGVDERNIILDGHFDLVAIARHMRDALRKDAEHFIASARTKDKP